MSSTRRGNDGERRAQAFLEDCGYLVASRRHIGGAGDLLAVEMSGEHIADEYSRLIAAPGFWEDEEKAAHICRLHSAAMFRARETYGRLLIEVKSDKAGPFATFPPAERQELLDTAERYGCVPLLAWTPYPSVIFWLPVDEWPR